MIYCQTTIMRVYDRPHRTNCFHSKLVLYIYCVQKHAIKTKPHPAKPNHITSAPIPSEREKNTIQFARCECGRMVYNVHCTHSKRNAIQSNVMQSKKFSYRMQIFTHLISFCLSSCSLIHDSHSCGNFQNKIRWNFMIIYACDKWFDANKKQQK